MLFIYLFKHLFMDSKLTIEIDFDNGNEPTIQIISRHSDDVRDKLIRAFVEKLQGYSSWCKIFCVGNSDELLAHGGHARWHIKPISPNEFKAEGDAILEQHRLLIEQSKDI